MTRPRPRIRGGLDAHPNTGYNDRMNTDKKHIAIIVLADGETWETIDGQSICIITNKDYNDLCEDRIPARDLEPLVEIGLKDYSPL